MPTRNFGFALMGIALLCFIFIKSYPVLLIIGMIAFIVGLMVLTARRVPICKLNR